MSSFFLILSALCFMATWGIHGRAVYSGNPGEWCGYMDVPLLSAIPWICGYLIAVIPEVLVFDISWGWLLLINILATWLIGPIIANIFLSIFKTGKGAGADIIFAIAIAIVTLIVGLLLK